MKECYIEQLPIGTKVWEKNSEISFLVAAKNHPGYERNNLYKRSKVFDTRLAY
jgi:hypothetical protein